MATEQAVRPVKTIPKFKEPPIIGSLLPSIKDRLKLWRQVIDQCGDIGTFRAGPIRMVLLNSPELIHDFIVDHAQDYDKGKLQHYAFQGNNGLFISEGAFHQRQRKLLAPSFQPRTLSSYADTMVEYADRAQAGWQEGRVLHLSAEMSRLTMEVVAKVLLSAEVHDESDELGHAFTTVFQWVEHAFTTLLPIPMNIPTQRNRALMKARQVLIDRIQWIIAERHVNPSSKNDMLSLLLQAQHEDGSHMTDQQVMDEVITFFGAGHETTAQALTWSFYLLTQHPAVYQRLQVELDTVLGGRLPTYADLPKLPYTLQIFKEAMRLYPPAAAVAREALRDTEIGGYPIKKGTLVLFSQWVLHHRPDFYPDPERFDPDRFSPENEKKLPRYAYLPFGAGHRICIGNHFALMEGHLLLATIAQKVKFDLLTTEPVKPKIMLTLRPQNSLKVQVKRRDL